MKVALIALLVLAPFGKALSQFGSVTYTSPDETLRAVVTPVNKANTSHESQVAIRSPGGQLIARTFTDQLSENIAATFFAEPGRPTHISSYTT